MATQLVHSADVAATLTCVQKTVNRREVLLVYVFLEEGLL